jgi:hypothetical protein
MDRAL